MWELKILIHDLGVTLAVVGDLMPRVLTNNSSCIMLGIAVLWLLNKEIIRSK